jgi:hypothetical protein
MHAMILAAAPSDWSFGGSILTFALPMILFLAVAGGLFVLYTTPHQVPGHRYRREQQASASVFAHAPVQVPGADGGTGASPSTAAGNGTAAASTGGNNPAETTGRDDPTGPGGQ